MELQTDICIVGAGPAGTSAALKLAAMGRDCLLVDKNTFPRDKVCGDALSGKVTLLMNRLDPGMLKRFEAQFQPLPMWGIRFSAPNGKTFDIPFESYGKEEMDRPPGYVSKRIDFDQFLVNEVKRHTEISFLEGRNIESYERTASGFRLSTSDQDFVINTKLLIDASGAHSIFARQQGLMKKPAHYSGSVRAYFKGVELDDKKEFVELHYLDRTVPGYFWIFPLPNGEVNVGLGIPSNIISNKKINLKKMFREIIDTEPRIKDRFRTAEQVSELEGYGIPLGSEMKRLSGDHYLITGDAGYLVDPLTGEGIGNAMYSGIMAAEQAVHSLDTGKVEQKAMLEYDKRVARVLGKEMKLSYRIQRMLRSKRTANIMASLIAGNQGIIETMSRMYADLELRKKITGPMFWINALFQGRKLKRSADQPDK